MTILRNLTATFSDGYKCPVTIRGNYPNSKHSEILICLAHNKQGYARVFFVHDVGTTEEKSFEAYDPWLKNVSEQAS